IFLIGVFGERRMDGHAASSLAVSRSAFGDGLRLVLGRPGSRLAWRTAGACLGLAAQSGRMPVAGLCPSSSRLLPRMDRARPFHAAFRSERSEIFTPPYPRFPQPPAGEMARSRIDPSPIPASLLLLGGDALI